MLLVLATGATHNPRSKDVSSFTPAEMISRKHAAACSAVATLRQAEAADGKSAAQRVEDLFD